MAQAREINEIAFPDFTDREWLDFTRGIYREEDGVPVPAYDPAIAQPMADEDGDAVPPDLWPVFDTAGNHSFVSWNESVRMFEPSPSHRYRDATRVCQQFTNRRHREEQKTILPSGQ